MLINEGADVIKLLYEDHFYDINFGKERGLRKSTHSTFWWRSFP